MELAYEAGERRLVMSFRPGYTDTMTLAVAQAQHHKETPACR